jgi:hypothetical protein
LPIFLFKLIKMKSKELHRINNLSYYHNRRNILIQQLGGKCVICGNTENL